MGEGVLGKSGSTTISPWTSKKSPKSLNQHLIVMSWYSSPASNTRWAACVSMTSGGSLSHRGSKDDTHMPKFVGTHRTKTFFIQIS